MSQVQKKNYEVLLEFVPFQEVEDLREITGFYFIEVLNDYLLFCEVADLPLNRETWIEYKETTEEAF